MIYRPSSELHRIAEENLNNVVRLERYRRVNQRYRIKVLNDTDSLIAWAKECMFFKRQGE